jgi:hypothetical protein
MDKKIQPWQNTIRYLLQADYPIELSMNGGTVDAETVISLLEMKIKDGATAASIQPGSIFHKFNKEAFAFTGTIHCGIALASLVIWINRTNCDEVFRKVLSGIVSLMLMFINLTCCTECE